jgi:hypothetical protein
VGCTSQAPGETNFPPVRWSDPSNPLQTGLAMSPGDTLFIQDSLQYPGGTPFNQNTFTVTIAPQTTGIIALRAPQADQSIQCNGAQQWTVWGPWLNNTGHNEYYYGANTYATSPAGKTVAIACLYTLDTDGVTQLTHQCTNANREGQFSFAPQTVLPGQYIIGQATNTCNAPGIWDWAGYIWMYY